MRDLETELEAVEPGLHSVLLAIAEGVVGVAAALRTASVAEAGTSNALGDAQLVADLEADARVLDALRACPAVAMASSEEQPIDIQLSQNGAFSVAYDPLDGSSIVGADWAVGSIFAVFPGTGFVGRSGRDLVASAYAVHGPRTVLVIARPLSGTSGPCTVQEFVLNDGVWALACDAITLAPFKKVFAPANLRAAAENTAYDALVKDVWMAGRYTLRYTGGMVPDVHHMLAKGGGVFCFPAAPGAPAKLRVLYEVLPLAHTVEAAGGATLGGGVGGGGSALEIRLTGHEDRATVCLGSTEEVARCVAAIAWSGSEATSGGRE